MIQPIPDTVMRLSNRSWALEVRTEWIETARPDPESPYAAWWSAPVKTGRHWITIFNDRDEAVLTHICTAAEMRTAVERFRNQ